RRAQPSAHYCYDVFPRRSHERQGLFRRHLPQDQQPGKMGRLRQARRAGDPEGGRQVHRARLAGQDLRARHEGARSHRRVRQRAQGARRARDGGLPDGPEGARRRRRARLPRRRGPELNFLAAVVFAAALPTAVPGGVAKIGLDAPAPLTVEGKRVLVMREAGKWVAVVGVPLSAKPGTKLRVEGERRKLEVRVVAKKYPQQRLTVPKDQAELDPERLAQYEKERKHLQAVLRTFTESAPASLAMREP